VSPAPTVESETPPAPVPAYPVVINATVESLIDYFTARDRERERFGLWLARSGRYLGMIRQVFRERGLPEELAYTAMIESGFSPRAVSRAGAKGLWQFMEATARRYGLVVNRWVDERFDPLKSTIAAAQYLGDLYGMFGHWFLAQAAYNAGEARIARAIQMARTSDFWALTQTRHLPQETKLFVPQILAATVITQAPARYGFEVTREPPLEFDEVTVRHALDLETVARLAEVPVHEVRELNLALRAGITPPFGAYQVRLPTGSGERFEQALQHARGLTTWVVHRIGPNQSLADIARTYRVSAQRLADVNQLRGGRLRGVTELLVPVSRSGDARMASAARVAWRGNEGTPPARVGAAAREVVVRRGDTLSAIAARHGMTSHAIAQANGRDVDDPIYPGDRLKVYTP
jgi:membrane-bound lytic murein transglycosylase D